MPDSVWRRVRARVHLSLTPAELSNPVRAATNRAFSSLLMRYSSELGGAVVAHIGPVQLSGPPSFIGASPFPHVVAIANLLVFAPTKGTQLLGIVTHVGPDHLGLSVLSAFHAVLPIDDLSHMYRFDTDYSTSTSTPTWRHINGQDKVTANRQIRFVVSDLKPTRFGLFQIIASLDHTLRDQPNDSHPLGLLPLEKQISLSAQSKQPQSDGAEPPNIDLPELNKRSTAPPENYNLTGDDLLMSGNDGFGDALMSTVIPPLPTLVSSLKPKKRARDGKVLASIGFGESGQDTHQKGIPDDPNSTEPRDIMSTAKTPRKMDRADDSNDGATEIPGSQADERSERKKRKREKKKKKQKRMSRHADETRTSEREGRAKDEQDKASSLSKVDEIRSGGAEGGNKEQRVVKQEERTIEEDIDSRDSAYSGRDLVQSARKDRKKNKKKKKKKRRKELHDGTDAEAQLQQRVANGTRTDGSENGGNKDDTVDRRRDERRDKGTRVMKREDKQISGNKTTVKKEKTMMRAEESAGDVDPVGVEINAEDDKQVVSRAERGERGKRSKRDDDDHRKVKKKRKRSSEGEIDSEMKRKKKKRKKRLSIGTENG